MSGLPIKLPLQPYADDFIRDADDNSVLMLMPALRTRAGMTKEQVDELRAYLILAINTYAESDKERWLKKRKDARHG